MGTRCNVIVKCGKELFQLYHHYDGYWEGVGQDIINYFDSHVVTRGHFDDFDYASSVAYGISDWNASFELEETFRPHGDIDYIYVIDLDSHELHCGECEIEMCNTLEEYSDAAKRQSDEIKVFAESGKWKGEVKIEKLA